MAGRMDEIKGSVQEWPRQRIAAGNWGGVQFVSPYLSAMYVDLKRGGFFSTRQLDKIADIGPAGRRTQDAFKRSEVSGMEGMIALWYHKTTKTQKMFAKSDSYIRPIESKRHLAIKYWEQRSRFLLASRMRLNTMRCTSVRLDQRVLGSRWVPCRFRASREQAGLYEKATCAYLNSTIGILAILGDRTNKIPSYPHFSLDDPRKLPVPNFPAMDKSQVTALATAYDSLCNMVLKPLPQMEKCDTRKALDRVVAGALGLKAEVISQIRRELTREPSITGKPYTHD